MVKILFFTVDNRIGGTEKIILSLATSLPRKEFSSSILTLKPSGLLHCLARNYGIPAYSLNIGSRGSGLLAPFRLFRFLLQHRPDILETFLFLPNILGRIIGWLAGIPVVISSQRSTDSWRRPYHHLLDRITAPLCRIIISNSQAGRKMLLKKAKIPSQKVVVISNGVAPATPILKEEARKILGFSGSGILLGSVGNLRTAKGFHYLLPAFREVVQRYPEAKLLIAGVGPLKEELAIFAWQLELADSVFFLGWLTDLGAFYSAIDLLVMTSLWEGMPVALLEALSYGVPVVATNVSGIPEVITDGVEGFLVEPANPHHVAERIIELLEDPQRRMEMGERGKTRVEKDFSLERMASAYAELYRRLVKEVK